MTRFIGAGRNPFHERSWQTAVNIKNGRMKRRVIGSMVLFATLSALCASAETVVWIGRPTVRDYFAYSARRAFEQAQELQQNVAVFNAQISDARRAYFAASQGDRAAAGDKFGELLLQKDLLIAMSDVMTGGGDQAQALAALFKLVNKGSLPDGGIPPSAASAFGEWVSDMQFRSGGVGRMPDPIRASQALLDGESLKSYEKYRRLRDQAEIDEEEASRNGGAKRLLSQSNVSASQLIGKTDAIGFDSRVRAINEQALRCIYAGTTGTTYYFWKGRPPEDINFLLAMNLSAGSTTFARLMDHAVDACPSDSKQASALASTNLKVPITPQMRKDGESQAHSLPLTPEQMARAAQAQKESAEMKAKMDARGAAFKACHDATWSEIEAARREHRRADIAEKDRACNAQVRIDHPEPVSAAEAARIADANARKAKAMELAAAFRACGDAMRAELPPPPVPREAMLAARQHNDQCVTAARSRYAQ